MFQVFTEQVPFVTKKNDSSVIFAILDGHRPDLPSYIQSNEALTQLVQRCWNHTPLYRPTAEEVCNDLRDVCPSYFLRQFCIQCQTLDYFEAHKFILVWTVNLFFNSVYLMNPKQSWQISWSSLALQPCALVKCSAFALPPMSIHTALHILFAILYLRSLTFRGTITYILISGKSIESTASACLVSAQQFYVYWWYLPPLMGPKEV